LACRVDDERAGTVKRHLCLLLFLTSAVCACCCANNSARQFTRRLG
jgi:hypothetical protein